MSERSIKSIKIIVTICIIMVVLAASYWYLFLQPSPKKEHLKSGDEDYWDDAYNWLKADSSDGTNFNSWWNYDFYLSDIDGHMVILDDSMNNLDFISNFHTATSEEEAIAVWIVRLLDENCKENNEKISENVLLVLEKYVDQSNADKIKNWIEKSATSPSYNLPIGYEYDENLSKQYSVGENNAIYHDATKLLIEILDDDSITWLYHDFQQATGHSFRYYCVDGTDKHIFNVFSFLSDKSLLLAALNSQDSYKLEDDFMQIKFVDTSEKSTYDDDLLDWLNPDESEQSSIENTVPYYKDAYFDTMLYRTYIGPSSGETGSKSEPHYQLPCINMRHFYAEYTSNITKGTYYENKVPVVIAKYYEGTYVNGTVSFMGNPFDKIVVIQKDLDHYNTNIPIDYDSSSTMEGNFNLIAPAGAKLQIRRYQFRDDVILKNVTFDSTTDSMLFPISDDDAMRKSDNYNRFLNISIDPANVEGYVYLNKDDNTVYNLFVDEPLSDVIVTLHELQDDGQALIERDSLVTDENGYFNKSGLTPGLYIIRAENKDGFIIHDGLAKLLPGNNYYSISKPQDAEVEGYVYYDENENGECDSGEEMPDVKVDITYNKIGFSGESIEKIFVSTIQTDASGHYEFNELIYGQYIINVTKQPQYVGSEEFTLEENKTTSFNISMRAT